MNVFISLLIIFPCNLLRFFFTHYLPFLAEKRQYRVGYFYHQACVRGPCAFDFIHIGSIKAMWYYYKYWFIHTWWTESEQKAYVLFWPNASHDQSLSVVLPLQLLAESVMFDVDSITKFACGKNIWSRLLIWSFCFLNFKANAISFRCLKDCQFAVKNCNLFFRRK